MEQYLNSLFRQFQQATGTKNMDVNSTEFIDEFSNWLGNMQSTGMEYTYFLDSLNFKFSKSMCAEVGKGAYDSVVIPYDTTIITPLVDSFPQNVKDKIIVGDMRVDGERPMLFKKSNEEDIVEDIPNDIIYEYMTQNPTTIGIRGWDHLHHSGNNGIIVGVYGSIHDKDMLRKLKFMKSFIYQLEDNYKESYVTSDDRYFYVVGTHGKYVKKKLKGKK